MSLRVAIVGATGLVGEELLEVLEERRFPVDSLMPLASARSVGRSVRFQGRDLAVQETTPERLRDCDVAFLSAGATVSRTLCPDLRGSGVRLYDNTSAFRLDPQVPLVVPEVNGSVIQADVHHYAVPNCTAILLVLGLAPLHQAFGLERVIVSTYQAISGAGRRAMDRMREDSRRLLQGDEPATDDAGPTPAFNVLPAIGPAQPRGHGDGSDTGEETKVAAEVRRLLGLPDLPVLATCVRVPVWRAHSESVYVELARPPSPEEFREVLAQVPWVTLMDDPDLGLVPTPRAASGIDGIHLGRIRSGDRAGSFSFFLCGDQLRKGAALNAVQIAEQHLECAASRGVS